MRKRIFYHYKNVPSSLWNTFIPDIIMKKIDPKEYMQEGWDSAPGVVHPYKRGSRHNKIGMWIMWIFYTIVIIQLLHVVSVLPFFPIPFMMILGLWWILYVAWRAR